MNNLEKLIVLRLVRAINNRDQPQRYKVSLPPKFGEMEARAAECAAVRAHHEAQLQDAIKAVMELVEC